MRSAFNVKLCMNKQNKIGDFVLIMQLKNITHCVKSKALNKSLYPGSLF